MEIKITRLNHQGEGIGIMNGKVIFVPNTLPDELVEIKLVKENKNYNEGMLIDLKKSSSKRIDPICPYFSLCGGCDLMHLSYHDQLIFKENKIKDLGHKITSIENLIQPIIENPNPLFYRNKATFQVKEKLGYYKKRSYEIVPVDKCYLVEPKINEIISKFSNISLKGIEKIIVRVSHYNNDSMVIIKGETNYNFDFLKQFVNTCLLNEKILFGKGILYEQLNNYQFLISPSSFFQVNTKQTENLYGLVKKLLCGTKEDTILDLYCGTGTIGLFVSDEVNKVIGIELNKDSIEDAKKNQKLNGVSNIQFYSGDSGEFVSKLKEKVNKVIVDPPRSGLDKKTILYLNNCKFEKVIYVSCDPSTLFRDLNLLNENYDIESITPIDIFSQTYHVECVVSLKSRNKN